MAMVPTYDEEATSSDSRDAELAQAAGIDPQEMAEEQEGLEGTLSEDLQPLDDDELLSVVTRELEDAIGQDGDDWSTLRAKAMSFYQGEMPAAPKGRSQAVSTDVADVVEWTLPQVMSALVQSDDVVSFEPLDEADEEQAQDETDAVEDVLMSRNDGFIYLMTCAKDALLEANGIGKVWWDQQMKVSHETYEGLTEQEVASLLQPQDGSEVRPVSYSQSQQFVTDPQTGRGTLVAVYDVTIARTRKMEGARVQPLPPEQFRLNSDHTSVNLEEARFTAHQRPETRGALVAMGFDRDAVMDLPPYALDLSEERQQRNLPIADTLDNDSASTHWSTQQVLVSECYIVIDRDGDGIPEMVQVWVGGDQSGGVMLGAEPVDTHPFVGCTAILMGHRFVGRSLYDRCADIQRQKTELLRQIEDNLKHQNNARTLVVAGQVNLDDLLTSRPGGVVRQKQPGMVSPLVAPQIGEWGYRHLDYLDSVRTGRAGVSPDTASVAQAIAGDTAHGLERLMSAKEELTGLMIRLLANTLVRGTMVKIRQLLRRHHKGPISFKAGGTWRQVNPSQWRERSGAAVLPALSTGDRGKRVNALQAVLAQMTQVKEAGGMGTLLTEDGIHAALSDFVRAVNLGDPSQYWLDPKSPEAQQARQQKQQQAEKARQEVAKQQQSVLQASLAIEEAKTQTTLAKAALDSQEKQSKLMAEYTKQLQDLALKYTELELKYAADVPGQGMEGGASAANPANPTGTPPGQ